MSKYDNKLNCQFRAKRTRIAICRHILTLVLLLLMACSPTAQNSKREIKGIVNLENELDNSGVKVGLYEIGSIKPEILESRAKWPQIGFEASQMTEFDHREMIPFQIVETGIQGDFIIEGIEAGIYNVVIVKPGWGIIYIYDIYVENEDIDLDVLNLKPVIELEGDISSNYCFEASRNYTILNNVNFVPGTEVIIENGAVIRLVNCTLSIWGSLDVDSNLQDYFWITNNDGMDDIGYEVNTPDIGGSLFFRSTVVNDQVLRFGKISYLGNGILSENLPDREIEISFMRITNCNCGINLNNLGGIDINNSIMDQCMRDDSGAMNIINTISGSVENNIIFNNSLGLRLQHRVDIEVMNNLFSGNQVGFKGLHYMGNLTHNEFIDNLTKDILICGTYGNLNEPMTIEYNNFNSGNNIGSFYDASYGVFCRIESLQNNNFKGTGTYIDVFTFSSSIDARFCYFNGITDEDEIDYHIYDNEEDDEYPTVDFSGFVAVEIVDAGIQ
ncbi:MAG: hypothetical protein K9J13_00425 [Saprospiraceae bacterium]|nr:hypothetical protein [Saprospiraceae bacterium]